jgi:hypothetical protein
LYGHHVCVVCSRDELLCKMCVFFNIYCITFFHGCTWSVNVLQPQQFLWSPECCCNGMRLKGTKVWWPLTVWWWYRTLSKCCLVHGLFGQIHTHRHPWTRLCLWIVMKTPLFNSSLTVCLYEDVVLLDFSKQVYIRKW